VAREGRIWTAIAGFVTPRAGDRRPRSRPDRPANPVGGPAKTTPADPCRHDRSRQMPGMRPHDAGGTWDAIRRRFVARTDFLIRCWMPESFEWAVPSPATRCERSCTPLPYRTTSRTCCRRTGPTAMFGAPSCASERARRRSRRPMVGACRWWSRCHVRRHGRPTRRDERSARPTPFPRPRRRPTPRRRLHESRSSPAARHSSRPIPGFSGRCAHNTQPAGSRRADSFRGQRQRVGHTVSVTSSPGTVPMRCR
jgi:hypothetical protein